MSSGISLSEEKRKIHCDVLDGIVPKRVPIDLYFSLTGMGDYAKVGIGNVYWSLEGVEEKADELYRLIPTDIDIFGLTPLWPSKYQALGSRSIIAGDNGFMQHPDTYMMEEDEYDEFIKDPYEFIVTKALPRVYKNLDFAGDPARAMMAIHQSISVTNSVVGDMIPTLVNLSKKYGGFSYDDAGASYAPMDFISDQLRSFSRILVDIRRHREQVHDAVEAVSPMNFKVACPNLDTYTRYGYVDYPLHMATFMRTKDFEYLWWPSFARQCNDLASLGVRCGAFFEHDWMRYLDYVKELPTGTVFHFEQGDPKEIKEKLNDNIIIYGGYPISNLTVLSPEECADRTKAWLDALAPNGNYIFGLNKGILSMNDCNIDNLKAVADTVYNYGVYDNAGQRSMKEFCKDDYQKSDLPEFKSSIYKTWEEYKRENPRTPEFVRDKVMAAEDEMLAYIYSLLL